MPVTGRANETGVSSKASSCAEAVRPPRLRAIVAVRLPKRTTEPPPHPYPLFSLPPPPIHTLTPPPIHTLTCTIQQSNTVTHSAPLRIAPLLTYDGRVEGEGGGRERKERTKDRIKRQSLPLSFFFFFPFFSFSAVDVTHCVRNLLNCVIPFFPNWPANVKAPMSSRDQIYY